MTHKHYPTSPIFNFIKIMSFIVVCLYGMYYYFIRGAVSNLKDFLMLGDINTIPVDATTFSVISSAFSVGYGLSQPISGYLIDKFCLRYVCPTLLIMATFFTFIFSNYTDPDIAIYSRFLTGCCFCVASIGGLKYVSLVWSKKFHIMSNFFTMSMMFSAALAASGLVKQIMTSIGWRTFFKLYVVIGIFIAIILFLLLNIVMKYRHNHTLHVDTADGYVDNAGKKFSIKNGFISIVKVPGFIFVALFVIASSSASYALMDGWGNSLLALKFENLSIDQLAMPATLNMFGTATGYLFNIVAGKLSVRLQMLIYFLIGFVSIFTIIYLDFCFNGFLICCFFLGMTCASQNVGFAYLQKNLNSKYIGLGFGLLNFACMFFGCAMVQRMAGKIVDMQRATRIGADLISGSTDYVYSDLLGMFNYLLIPSIICGISVLFFKESKNK